MTVSIVHELVLLVINKTENFHSTCAEITEKDGLLLLEIYPVLYLNKANRSGSDIKSNE